VKRQKKPQGALITWMPAYAKTRQELVICVAIKGIDGYMELPWDRNEPRGAHYAAALKVAKRRGFDDVKETGVLETGNGFIFEPIFNSREGVINADT